MPPIPYHLPLYMLGEGPPLSVWHPRLLWGYRATIMLSLSPASPPSRTSLRSGGCMAEGDPVGAAVCTMMQAWVPAHTASFSAVERHSTWALAVVLSVVQPASCCWCTAYRTWCVRAVLGAVCYCLTLPQLKSCLFVSGTEASTVKSIAVPKGAAPWCC